MTRVVMVDSATPDRQAIGEAAACLRRGLLVAFPTETVYGLGVHALDAAAVERLFRAKGRPLTDPVIVHLAHADRMGEVARDIPGVAHDLARRFWPGALTLILPRHAAVPDAVTAGQTTIGVRVPSHPVAMALLAAAAVPVAAPSANRFGRPSPTKAAHVLADLDGVIDLIVDGGATPIGVESTVLDLTVSPPLVRRPGGVSIDDIRAVVADVQRVDEVRSPAAAQPAPGQLQRHYAPHAQLTLYTGPIEGVARRLSSDVRTAIATGHRVGILAPEEDLLAMAPGLGAAAATGRVLSARYGARARLAEAAQDLFSAMRELDAAGVDVILAVAPDRTGIGEAVLDRLTRAAEGRIVRV